MDEEQVYLYYGCGVGVYYLLLLFCGTWGWSHRFDRQYSYCRQIAKFFKYSTCLSRPMITGADTISDIVLLTELYQQEETQRLFILSLFILIYYAILGRVYRYLSIRSVIDRTKCEAILGAILQSLGLQVFVDVYSSYKDCENVYELRENQLWQTCWESIPQIVLQSYCVVEYNEHLSTFVYLSIMISCYSITMTYNDEDIFGIPDNVSKSWRKAYIIGYFVIRYLEIMARMCIFGLFVTFVSARALFWYCMILCICGQVYGLWMCNGDYFRKNKRNQIFDGCLSIFCVDLNMVYFLLNRDQGQRSRNMQKNQIYVGIFIVLLKFIEIVIGMAVCIAIAISNNTFDHVPIWICFGISCTISCISFLYCIGNHFDIDQYYDAKNGDVESLINLHKFSVINYQIKIGILSKQRVLSLAHKIGVSVHKIRNESGIRASFNDLLLAGYTKNELEDNDYNLDDLEKSEDTSKKLLLAGYTNNDLQEAGYNICDSKEAGDLIQYPNQVPKTRDPTDAELYREKAEDLFNFFDRRNRNLEQAAYCRIDTR